MPSSKAQQKATNKYINKAYDRVNLTLPKGKKEEIKSHVEGRSESVNGFIAVRLIVRWSETKRRTKRSV